MSFEIENPVSIPIRFFRSLKEGNFKQTWSLLTEKSQHLAAYSLVLSLQKPGMEAEVKQQLANDKSQLFSCYWPAFRSGLDIDKWLAQTYRLQGAKENFAVVLAQPAGIPLHIVKEQGSWKFGYVESFLESP